MLPTYPPFCMPSALEDKILWKLFSGLTLSHSTPQTHNAALPRDQLALSVGLHTRDPTAIFHHSNEL